MDGKSLKSNLYYNITADEIVGFHKVNGSSFALPANSVLVLFAEGVHVNWKQAVGDVFTHSICAHIELDNFGCNTIRKLFEIGLHVRAIISAAGSNFISFALKKA